MDAKATTAWFEQIAATKITHHPKQNTRLPGGGASYSSAHYDLKEATAWLTNAQSALESVFPAGHAVLKRWHSVLAPADSHPSRLGEIDLVEAAQAVFMAAFGQVKGGQITSLVNSVRADTVSEVLDQADALINKKYHVAAAVLAGGSLETHLRHLCNQHSIAWKGDGSISGYNDAIAQERNKGNAVYDANDGKSVTAWGGQRNAAAHDPVNFTAAVPEVRLMIQGIRHFMSKTS